MERGSGSSGLVQGRTLLRFRVQKATSGQCGLDSRGSRVACGKDRLYCLRF